MIVMATITDTLRSPDLSGYSVHNTSSTNTSSSTEPRNKFQYTAGVISTLNPVSGPPDSKTIPPARIRRASKRLASKSQTETSAARCCIIVRHELKSQRSKAQSQPENTQVGDSMNFQYSAMKPTTCVSSSAAGSTLPLQAKHTYRRNVAVHAINKKGSYVHYLTRRIKLFKSKMTSYADDVVRQFNLASSKIDSYNQDLNRELNLMNAKIAPYTHDVERKIKLLNSRVVSYSNDICTVCAQLHSKVRSYVDHVSRNLWQLHSKIGPYAEDVDRQMRLVESLDTLHREQFRGRFDLIWPKVDSFDQLKMDIKNVLIKNAQN